MRGICHDLGSRHADSQKGVFILAQKIEGFDNLLLSPFCIELKKGLINLSGEQDCRCRIPAVQLVAHPQGTGHERLQRNRAALLDCRVENGRKGIPQPVERLTNFVIISTVIQLAAVRAFVKAAKRTMAVLRILNNYHRH